MKKTFFILLYFICIFGSIYGQHSLNGRILDRGDSFGFSIEPSFGYLNGQAREIVYDTNDKSTGGEVTSRGTYYSELIWELKDILYAGASASANFNNRLYINGGIWTAVNKGRGFMNDYDWVLKDDLGNPYVLHDRNGKKDISHWSLSTVEVVRSLIIDSNIAYDLLPRRSAGFSLSAGYRYLFWDWTDIIIDSMYSGVDDYLTTGVNAIDYQLGLHIPYFGIAGGLNSPGGFVLSGRFIYSPMVMGNDHDHHIRRTDFGPDGVHFYDYIRFGQYLGGTVQLGYQFSSVVRLTAQVGGEYLFETRGGTHVFNTWGGIENYEGTASSGAGMQYQSLSFSINVEFGF